MGWTDVFADFAATTDDTYFDSPDKLINQATERSPLLGKFLKASGTAKIIKGGERMRFQTFFDEVNTAVDYGGPNPTLSISNPQIVTEGVADWRFSADHMAWTDHEIGLQVNTSMTREARYRRIRDLYAVKEQRLATSIIKHMEDHLFAVPDESMEGSAGSKPFSIPTFITENDSGQDPHTSTTTWSTTLEGIDPSANWGNQVVFYDKSTGLNAGNGSAGSYGDVAATDAEAQALFAAFDEMMHLVQYNPLPMYEGQSEALNNPNFIAASKAGRKAYMTALRQLNDQLVAGSRQDPAYLNPLYAGVPVIYASRLDTAALYDSEGKATGDASTGVVSEGTATADVSSGVDVGPRFYWIDTDVLCKVFHDERYFSRKQPQPHPNQPFSHVMWVDCWHQLVCTERRKLGIISPQQDA
jgi:hypothetical protein